jgi:O-antigen ligase
MVERLDWSRFVGAVTLALVAAPVGLLAGFDPRFAILAALGFGFVLLAFNNLAAGLAVFSFLSFVQVVPVGNIAKLIGLLLALSWFALMTTRPRADLEFLTIHPIMSAVLGLFLAWALLSTTWAESTSAALGSTGRYALNAVLFLIIFTAVRTPKQLGWVLLAFALGGAVAAIYGILSPPDSPARAAGRLGSQLLDPNQLAAILVAGGVLAIAVIVLYRRSPLIRLLGILTGAFTMVAIWLTASRGAVIALLVLTVFAFVFAGRWRVHVTVAVVLLGLATYTYYAAIASPETTQRLTESTQGETQIQEGRTTLWQVAWRAYEAHPVEGIGAGNFPVSSKHFLLAPGLLGRTDDIIGGESQVVHNSWLEVATETGTVGFVLFATVIGFSLACMLRGARAFGRAGDRRMQGVAICMAIALVGLLAGLTFISDQYNKGLWLLLGLGPAVLAMAQAAERERELSPPR